eukprot:1393853-Rhodomonas_salina.3
MRDATARDCTCMRDVTALNRTRMRDVTSRAVASLVGVRRWRSRGAKSGASSASSSTVLPYAARRLVLIWAYGATRQGKSSGRR